MSLPPSALENSVPSLAPEVNAQHPWLGLLPYKEEHSDFFFGRDREVEDILGRIRDNSLTILYGQSGLGKSSLLAAGVVPRLRKQGFAPRIIRLSFTNRATLREQMMAALPSRPPFIRSASEPGWIPSRASLWELFHRKSSSDSEPCVPVLVFDQFEEIFTLGGQPKFEHQVTEWLEQLADLLQNRPPRHLAEAFARDPALADQYHFGDPPVRIVFALREDYLAHLERWKARLPLLMQNRMALTLLTGPQARLAVLSPAQLGDHSLVSREVAESIVRTVARVSVDTPLDQIKAVPPLLSLLCEQLNAARLSADNPQITAESVRDQAADILQRFYEDSFLSFPQEHRSRIRALLEDPPMITEAGYRNALVRDDAEAQLTRAGVNEVKTIFDSLIQRRLITAETRDQVQRLEITHDVLVPLLLRSRKERQDREAKEQAQRSAVAAEAEQERLKTERRRLWFLVAAMTSLAIAALGFAAYGWWQAQLAQKAETKALQAATKEKEANEKNLRTLHEASMADYAVAVQRIEKENKWHEGVAHLARSLKWEPTNSLAATWLYSTLALHAPEKQSWPRKILPHEDWVKSAQFSPDGSRIVTASDDTVRVWNAASSEPLIELPHEDWVNSAQFSPDGIRIVTASGKFSGDKGEARVWDVASGEPAVEPLRHDARVNSAQFSPDGSRILTASDDKTAIVWDAASGKSLIKLPHEYGVESAQFSPDGSRIVTASGNFDDKSVARVWDAVTGAALGEPLLHEKGVNSAQFSPDGTHIITSSLDDTAKVWDAASAKPFGEPLRHEEKVNGAQFSSDGSRILTASGDFSNDQGVVSVWDATRGKLLIEHLRHLKSAQFSPDGCLIFTVDSNNTARVHESVNGNLLGKPLPLGRAEFSPDGARIISVGKDQIAQIWDVASGELVKKLSHEDNLKNEDLSLECAQFSPDGSRIVTFSTSGGGFGDDGYCKTQVRVFDATSYKKLVKPMLYEGCLTDVQFSMDGSRMVFAIRQGGIESFAGDDSYELRVYDLISGNQFGTPLDRKGSSGSEQFSRDGSRIVIVNYSLTHDDVIQVKNPFDGKTHSVIPHKLNVKSAQFSLDGSRILTASDDKTSRVWDADTGKRIGESLPHGDTVNNAQFSQDGNRIVTVSDDNTARVWESKEMLHAPVPVPPWMLQCANAIAGLDFDDVGEMKTIPAEKRRDVLLRPPPANDPWSGLASWLALPANERTFTPDSKFTCREIAERERDSGLKEGLESALRYDPTVPLARLLLAGALLREEEEKKPEERDPSLPQRAAFLRDYDLKRLPDIAGLWIRAAKSLAEQKDFKRSLQAAEKALKLDPLNAEAKKALEAAQQANSGR